MITVHPTSPVEGEFPVRETVEIRGHVIDSLLLPKILEIITSSGGSYRILQLDMGREQSDPSFALIEVAAGDANRVQAILASLAEHGAVPLSPDDSRRADRRREPRAVAVAIELEQRFPTPFSQPHILMCPPDFYGIEYEINAWMSRARQADSGLAARQWLALKGLLEEAGAAIELLAPREGLPDLVFTANAALIYKRRAVLSRFRPTQRQGEEPIDEAYLAAQGFEILKLPEGTFFEGAGDALFCGETLFAGYRIRSDARGQQRLGDLLGCRTLPLELVDPYYYHLDTCFCPLAPGQAIYYPGALDDYGHRVLEERVEELIPVAEAEARAFACNAVVVGKTVVTNTGCPQLHDDLRALGYTPQETPLGEFVKAGGSAKCLTLRLDGEEAAAWKREACE